jgi:hypothetical protein
MTEQQRLDNLRNDNKITEAEYALLIKALYKKESRFMRLFLFLMNPFAKIAGFEALILGFILMLVMTSLQFTVKIYTTGFLELQTADSVKNTIIEPSFLLILYQNFIVSFLVGVLFIFFAKIFRKKIRIIDALGMAFLARAPYFFVTVWAVILNFLDPSYLAPGVTHASFLSTLSHLVIGIVIIWQGAIYVYALKESTGLQGRQLILSSLGAFFLATFILSQLTMIFF